MQIDVYSQIGFVMLIGLAAKNCHSDRRIRQAAARRGLEHRRGGDGGGAAAPAADPDDGLRLHPRRAAADVRDRRGRGEPAIDRHHRVRRHARGHGPDADLRSGLLCAHRAAARAARRGGRAVVFGCRDRLSPPSPALRNNKDLPMRVRKVILGTRVAFVVALLLAPASSTSIRAAPRGRPRRRRTP